MLYKTKGIVFRTIKYSETSVVSKIYTEKFGVQSYIVNGVRTARSKVKASLLQSLSLLELEVYHREHRNLHRIKEVQAAVVFRSIPFHLLKGSVGLFMIEVLNKVIHEEEANPSLFQFIFDQVRLLDETEQISPLYLAEFMIALSAHLGFVPHGIFSAATPCFDLREGQFVKDTPGHVQVLDQLTSSNLSAVVHQQPAVMSPLQRKMLLEALLHYYQLHVPGFSPPKSLKVLEEVFRS